MDILGLQKRYEGLLPGEIVKAAFEDFRGDVALISSFGADSVALLDLVAKIDKNALILFLDTKKHFKETYDYVERIRGLLGLTNLQFVYPDENFEKNIDKSGDMWSVNPNKCCYYRKTLPLENYVKKFGVRALITGRKGYQTKERSGLDNIELDQETGVFKINPFADIGQEKFEILKKAGNLPIHPLYEKGYLSIGCEPCTAIVGKGEDPRSGRWSHTKNMKGGQKQECGIHL